MYGFARVLLIIGGLNWGLVGLGIFLKKDLNFISLLSAYYIHLPAIVYCVLGVAAIWLIVRK